MKQIEKTGLGGGWRILPVAAALLLAAGTARGAGYFTWSTYGMVTQNPQAPDWAADGVLNDYAVVWQLIGTPVVSSTVCAIPEICGRGGVFCDPDDVPGVAAALRLLLQDAAEWARLSAAARVNAERFAWSRCSRPLVECLVEVAEQCGASQLIP